MDVKATRKRGLGRSNQHLQQKVAKTDWKLALEYQLAKYNDDNSYFIFNYFIKNQQSNATYNNKIYLRNCLQAALCAPFPGSVVHIVGSSANGFGSDKSDLDLCLCITDAALNQRSDCLPVLQTSMFALQRFFPRLTRISLIRAKVPILKMYDLETGLECDLNVNSKIGIHNTHLLAMYSRLDWRVRPLAMFVKFWAQCLDIHDASRARLSSYSLILLVIHYLQVGESPAILPSLQQKYPAEFSSDSIMIDMTKSLPFQHPSSNTRSLADLFHGFINYYANFDFSSFAVSVRLAKAIPMSVALNQLPAHERPKTERGLNVFVEEPFTLMNTAHSLHDMANFSRTLRAFRRTASDLNNHRPMLNIIAHPA